MKKILSSALFLLLAFTALAGEPFFCTTPGRKLYYERYNAGTTDLVQTTNFDIDSLSTAPSGETLVHYGVTMKKKGEKPIFGGRASLVATIRQNGDALMDFGAAIKEFVKNIFPRVRYKKTEGTLGLLPANMQPGDTLPEANCKLKLTIISVSIRVIERQVLRKETVTTPAGTFDCTVVRERKIEDAPFHHLDNYMDNWYVAGLGYVRHDVYDNRMNPELSEVLVSIQ